MQKQRVEYEARRVQVWAEYAAALQLNTIQLLGNRIPARLEPPIARDVGAAVVGREARRRGAWGAGHGACCCDTQAGRTRFCLVDELFADPWLGLGVWVPHRFNSSVT